MTRVNCISLVPSNDQQTTATATMSSEGSLKSVKDELPLATQDLRHKKTRGFIPHRRAVAAGLFIGLVLWSVHKQWTSTPAPWLEGHLDLLRYNGYSSLAGKEAEELFL